MTTTRTCLVTGANRGLGLATAVLLARAGRRVLLGSRDLAAGGAAADDLRRAVPGADARAVALDVEDGASIAALVGRLAAESVRVDVLVNNAGIYPEGDLFTVPERELRRAMEVHFFGPLALARAFVPPMRGAGYGRVVNVSSGYGSLGEGLEGDAAYSLSKAALNALTVKLAAEAGPVVKVNAVCPGWVRTRMGGPEAHRSVEEGADTIAWLALLPDDGPTGGFFRDRAPIPW